MRPNLLLSLELKQHQDLTTMLTKGPEMRPLGKLKIYKKKGKFILIRKEKYWGA